MTFVAVVFNLLHVNFFMIFIYVHEGRQAQLSVRVFDPIRMSCLLCFMLNFEIIFVYVHEGQQAQLFVRV